MITKMYAFTSQPSVPELPLGASGASTDAVQVRGIQGLEPVKAEISSTPFATSDGELYQGATVGKRNIVLTLGLNPDWIDQTMATLRQQLYLYFMPKSWVKLRFETDYLPTVDIEGYCESITPNIFSKDPEVQVSIICPKPDFIDTEPAVFTGTVDDGTSDTVINYIGTVPTGFELRVDPASGATEYTGPLTVTNDALIPQTFKIDPVTIDALKYFKLSTIKNAKRAQNIAAADGAITNLLAHVQTAVWPEIQVGENLISVFANTPGQAWTLAYFNRFGGL